MEDKNIDLEQLNNEETPAVSAEAPSDAPAKSKKPRRRGWFFMRLAIFVCISLMALTYFIYVFTPKYPYGICFFFIPAGAALPSV